MVHMLKNVATLLLGFVLTAESLAQAPQYIRGPRGGCYEVTKSGGKRPVKQGLCDSQRASEVKTPDLPPANQQPLPAEQNKVSAPSRTAPKVSKTNASTASSVEGSQTGHTYTLGPKGGCYELTKSGSKRSVDRGFCNSAPATRAEIPSTVPAKQQPTMPEPSRASTPDQLPAEAQRTIQPRATNAERNQNGHTYITGPRGGCYYVTASGRKQYVDHSMCR